MKKLWITLGVVLVVAASVWGALGMYFTHDIKSTMEDEDGTNNSVLTSELNAASKAKADEDKFSFLHSDDYYQSDQYNTWRASYMITHALGDDNRNSGKIANVSEDHLRHSQNVAAWFPWLRDDVDTMAKYVNQEPVDIDTTRDSFVAHEIEAGCEARAEGSDAEEKFFEDRDVMFEDAESGNADVRTTRWVSVLYGMDEVCAADTVAKVESKETKN